MTERYTGRIKVFIQDLDWLIKELEDEKECIKLGMMSEPLSGLIGFLYGLQKDFGLSETDMGIMKGQINATAMDMNYPDARQMDPKQTTLCVYGSINDVIKIVRATKHAVMNKSKKFN